MAPLTVAVLNHNGRAVLGRCLDAVRRQALPHRLLVIDNASTDDSWHLAQQYGAVVVHADNRAQYLTGLNTAFQAAQTPWVCFLQNDVLLEAGALSRLLLWGVEQHPHSIIQPVLRNSEGSVNHAGGHWYWPGIGLGGWWDYRPWPYRTQLFATSCFLMSQDTYRRVGPFDVRLAPAYYEDVDYALRAERHGIDRWVLPQARAIHLSTFTFHQTHTRADLSAICQAHRHLIVDWHTSGLDRWLRHRALTLLDRLAGDGHGDTHRVPPRRHGGQGGLGLT